MAEWRDVETQGPPGPLDEQIVWIYRPRGDVPVSLARCVHQVDLSPVVWTSIDSEFQFIEVLAWAPLEPPGVPARRVVWTSPEDDENA